MAFVDMGRTFKFQGRDEFSNQLKKGPTLLLTAVYWLISEPQNKCIKNASI
jgi:hypothetical protein